ncbi:MAG TPA: hypothetical protein VM425_19735 [Myxococcota bacterium]|nr:hypothetical protein [Myxococcota bacterium]
MVDNLPKKHESPATLRAVVALSGTAKDAKAGAVVLVGEAGMPVYLEGMASWPDKDLNHERSVEGVISSKHMIPEATRDEQGGWSQGVAPGSGPEWVIENPRVVERALAPKAMPIDLMRAAWPERAACLDSIRKAVIAGGEKPADFYVGAKVESRSEHLVFALWHRDAFLPENKNVTGNPGGKCRNALCLKKTSSFERFLYWQ